jgi:hypothetical protein
MTPSLITANALLEGDVIYLTAQDSWARTMADAEVFNDEAVAEERLFSVNPSEAVGAYLMPVSLTDGAPAPLHFREAFRATGPSNRFHGKQSEAF